MFVAFGFDAACFSVDAKQYMFLGGCFADAYEMAADFFSCLFGFWPEFGSNCGYEFVFFAAVEG